MNRNGAVRAAIELMLDGNYDQALTIATLANTSEAQRLFREAVEREAHETKERREAWAEFVRKAGDIWC